MEISCIPDVPRGFGYKNAWLALSTSDTNAVVRALGLIQTQVANWETGIDAAYQWRSRNEQRVFVTPPLEGWTLAVGIALEEFLETRETLCASIGQWSLEFGEAQLFGTHRVMEAHFWARAQRGHLMRVYSYDGSSGNVYFDSGAQTPEEIALGFNFFDPNAPKANDESYWERADLDSPSESNVMQIAEAWGLSPQKLGQFKQPSVGILGFLPLLS